MSVNESPFKHTERSGFHGVELLRSVGLIYKTTREHAEVKRLSLKNDEIKCDIIKSPDIVPTL